MKFIFDNSALVALIERLKLHSEFNQLSTEINFIVPAKVFEEFCKKASNENQEFVRSKCQIMEISSDERLKKYLEEDSGEIFILSHALYLKEKNEQFNCVIDERPARNVAALFELPNLGTIGILKTMHEKNIILKERLPGLKKQIIESDFRVEPKYLEWMDYSV